MLGPFASSRRHAHPHLGCQRFAPPAHYFSQPRPGGAKHLFSPCLCSPWFPPLISAGRNLEAQSLPSASQRVCMTHRFMPILFYPESQSNARTVHVQMAVKTHRRHDSYKAGDPCRSAHFRGLVVFLALTNKCVLGLRALRFFALGLGFKQRVMLGCPGLRNEASITAT